MNMELDEMKLAWQALDRRVARSEAANFELKLEVQVGKTRSLLRRWLWLPAIEFVAGLLTAFATGSFLGDHLQSFADEPLGFIPGAALMLLALATVAASVRQFVLVGGIDYAAPVVGIQRRLLAARTLRLRIAQWGLLLGLPLWPVFVAFAMQCAFGYGSYRIFGLAWMVPVVAVGVALMVLSIWIARRYAGALARSPLLGKLGDEIAGHGLVAALGQMEEVARFEQE